MSITTLYCNPLFIVVPSKIFLILYSNALGNTIYFTLIYIKLEDKLIYA